MNHIEATCVRDGRSIRYHLWENGEGSYRRRAFVLGAPFWKPGKERKLTNFLLAKGFLVMESDFGLYGPAPRAKRVEDAAARVAALADFADERIELPDYLVAWSVSAIVALQLARLGRFRAFIFLGPVFAARSAAFTVPGFFGSRLASFAAAPDGLSSRPEEVHAAFPALESPIKLPKRIVKTARVKAQRTQLALERLSNELPVGIFSGEDDPYSDARADPGFSYPPGATVKLYPRARHLAPYDRHSDALLEDLGLFLDGVEAST